MAELAPATAITTLELGRYPARIIIPSGNPHLPVSPPCPSFDGISTDINTEPFPDFQDDVDLDAVEDTESLHCSLHCHETICKRTTRSRSTVPLCRCASEKDQPVEEMPPRPALQADDLVLGALWALSTELDPDRKIEIHLSDIHESLAHLENHCVTHALGNSKLLSALKLQCRGNAVPVALETMERLFTGIRLYFDRTLRESGYRVLSLQQLRTELDVYHWTMLDDWVKHYCDKETAAMVSRLDLRHFRHLGDFGVPGAVSGFWKDCMDNVVGLMVWRDEEVRQAKADQGRTEKTVVKLTQRSQGGSRCGSVCDGVPRLVSSGRGHLVFANPPLSAEVE